MAMLEVALQERSMRESLFELGILKMSDSPSPAPSPPPLSVVHSTHQNAPDFASIYHDVHDQKAMSTSADSDGDVNHGDVTISNEIEPSRKRRKLMNGQTMHRQRESLVLTDYLGMEVADKLDEHLYNRPAPMELIHRGIVPHYSFTKKFSTPSQYAKHSRNMTLELANRLEDKLKARPLIDDLPKKVYAVQNNLRLLVDEHKISESEQHAITKLLNDIKAENEKHLEALKGRYWAMMVEQKDKFKALERVSAQNEMLLRQKMETMSARCQSLSSHLIVKNNALKEQEIEFRERLERLQRDHRQQYERQQTQIKAGNAAQRGMREAMQRREDLDNLSLQQVLEKDKQFLLQQIESAGHLDRSSLLQLTDRINKMEANYHSDLQRERSMHRKFSEQSERVKQTLVDEINKMEEQHQGKVQKLENQMLALKEKNRKMERKQKIEMSELTHKMTAEIDKQRNIAKIMAENDDEEKARLRLQMEALKTEYESKIETQNEEVTTLRAAAETATTSLIERDRRTRASMEEVTRSRLEEKDRIIEDLRSQLRGKETMQRSYERMRSNKQQLEQQVLMLSQQILDTFSTTLSDDVKRKLSL